MNLLGASILFARGTNTHNQLKIICSEPKVDKKFITLLDFLDKLYMQDNTQYVRSKLQSFLVEYGEEIYREYSKTQVEHGVNDFMYDLKPEKETK